MINTDRCRSLCSRPAGGFTLIELITAIAIIGILAAIAYPSYISHVTTTRRDIDGQGSMLELAARLQKFHTSCGSYTSAIIGGSVNGCTGLELLTDMSKENYYQMNVALVLNANGVATGYTINAVPQGSQATKDTDCATLTLTSAGIKGQTGPNTGNRCWKK